MAQIRDINIKNIQSIPPPKEYIEALPITDVAADTVIRGRREIARILSGRDKRMVMIVGPCSIHDVKAGMEYAHRLRELAALYKDRLLVVMRVYFQKPRTTVGWKGIVHDPHLNGTYDTAYGLRLARRFLLDIGELGLCAATEFVDTITPQYLADLVSWAAIGARTSESQTHREMASGLSMPVGFKNSTSGNVQVAVEGVVSAQTPHAFLGVNIEGLASIVTTAGNPYCHIILRGSNRGPNYHASSITEAVALLEAAHLQTRLMVDCSHGNSGKNHIRQSAVFHDLVQQRTAGNENIVGIMLESNLFPGNQRLNGDDPSALKYGVSITDACIGWEETARLLTEAYYALEGQSALQPSASTTGSSEEDQQNRKCSPRE